MSTRLVDLACAATALSLAIRVGVSPGAAPARWALTGLYLAAAVALVVRRAPAEVVRLGPTLRALPSILSGVCVVGAAWLPAEGLVLVVWVVGVAWTLAALAALGTSFGVLPADRGLVSRGPYRWVRHPMYLGELIMLGACCLQLGGVNGVVIWTACWAAAAWRVAAEEQVLAGGQGWSSYSDCVKWRLIPMVW